MKYKAVIFDMDGVIFDSERLYIECDKEAARSHGFTDMDFIEEVCIKCIGVTNEETQRIMKESFGDDFPLQDLWKEASALFREKSMDGKLPVKPGVREILEYLKRNENGNSIFDKD